MKIKTQLIMEILNRTALKSILAGSGGICGNVYCSIGGQQTLMGAYGCNPEDPYEVTLNAWSNCELEAAFQETTCDGCAQFPQVN
jgi:hypothetical protein